MSALQQIISEVEPINLTRQLAEIENSIEKFNSHESRFAFDVNSVAEMIENYLQELDWADIDITFGSSAYWHTILFAFPFDELLESRFEREEDVLTCISRNNMKVDWVGDEIKIVFYNNTNSPLYRWFLKNRDGYGGNIPESINLMMVKLWEEIKDMIHGDIDKRTILGIYYGDLGGWYNAIYCHVCDASAWGDSPYCPECDTESNQVNGMLYEYGRP